MNDERERQIAVTSLSLLGIAALVYIGGAASLTTQEAAAYQNPTTEQSPTVLHQGAWPPTPTPMESHGQLVHPLPEGITLPDTVGKNGEPLLEVISKSGKIYTVQKIETGQYKIIEPEPKLFDIRFLRESDIAAFR